VFNVKQGWGPLCEFLGKTAPSTPFPHRNKKGEYAEELFEHKLFKQMNTEALISASMLVLLSGYVAYDFTTKSKEASLFHIPARLLDFAFAKLGYERL